MINPSRLGEPRPDAQLACKLHEGFGNQGVMVKAVGLIVRESIAVAMV